MSLLRDAWVDDYRTLVERGCDPDRAAASMAHGLADVARLAGFTLARAIHELSRHWEISDGTKETVP